MTMTFTYKTEVTILNANTKFGHLKCKLNKKLITRAVF